MTTITAIEHVTLDGVMQAPAGPDEDTRGGFAHGGWALPYGDEVQAEAMAGHMARANGGLLLGRRTYEHLVDTWAGRDDNPFSPVLEARTKYVVSTAPAPALPWRNSVALGSVADVERLKASAAEDELAVLGSGELLRALLAAGLVDALLLQIHPLVLGSGTRLFATGGPRLPLELTGSVVTTTGVTIASYRAAG